MRTIGLFRLAMLLVHEARYHPVEARSCVRVHERTCFATYSIGMWIAEMLAKAVT